MDSLPLAWFDYDLPEHLIAQVPAKQRDGSRLLHVQRTTGQFSHHQFAQIGHFFKAGDVLVLNQTKVIPARMVGSTEHGGHVELLFHRPEQGSAPEQSTRWWAMGKPGKSFKVGKRIALSPMQCPLEVIARDEQQILVQAHEPIWPLLHEYGSIPLPPYIRRDGGEEISKLDQERYQAVFAKVSGSVAAPTASLHFTPEILAALQQQGVSLRYLCLHVGLGTFLPIRSEHQQDVRAHKMLPERYEIPLETCQTLSEAKAQRQRIIAVGTTVVRALESYGQSQQPYGEANVMIVPGHDFVWIDGLLTNFHLPRSTLMLLVSALAGRTLILQAYQAAVAEQYRFFSYGDAMLIT